MKSRTDRAWSHPYDLVDYEKPNTETVFTCDGRGPQLFRQAHAQRWRTCQTFICPMPLSPTPNSQARNRKPSLDHRSFVSSIYGAYTILRLDRVVLGWMLDL